MTILCTEGVFDGVPLWAVPVSDCAGILIWADDAETADEATRNYDHTPTGPAVEVLANSAAWTEAVLDSIREWAESPELLELYIENQGELYAARAFWGATMHGVESTLSDSCIYIVAPTADDAAAEWIDLHRPDLAAALNEVGGFDYFDAKSFVEDNGAEVVQWGNTRQWAVIEWF